MSRIVLISNRLPLQMERRGGEWSYEPSAGGLATGLNSLDASWKKIWIGWPGKEIEDPVDQEIVRQDLAKLDLAPVFLSQEDIEKYYEGFSNKTLWPHFHYFTQYTTYSDEYWEAYLAVNRKFAEAVIPQLRADDLVWVHDYQLLLLPRLIREALPEVSIGFFLHIPFPSYELFRMLPWREQLLEGMLGADLIGFHTFDYMRHFLSTAYRLGGYEHQFGQLRVGERLVKVDVFPMGIDYEKFARPDFEEREETRIIRQMAADKCLILSIDRLDYSKGIELRLEAFRRFLEQHPKYRGKVTLVMVVVPSRSNVDQYQELKELLDKMTGDINSAFGAFDWTPIQYFYRSLSFDELVTLYQVSDLALITPHRDGMNLIAKEFVAGKENSDRGVLLLSEMAGAANELSEALILNPQDLNRLVEGLVEALEMEEPEQQRRLKAMQQKLRKFDIRRWANTFITQQRQVQEIQRQEQTFRLGQSEVNRLQDVFQQAERRLFLLDIDETLFASTGMAVSGRQPDQRMIKVLEQLHREDGNTLVINSGHDREILLPLFDPIGIDLVAGYGAWIKRSGEWQPHPNLSGAWKEQVRELLESLAERTPGSYLEEKEFALAWHYGTLDREFGEQRVRESRDMLRFLVSSLDLQVVEGNRMIEIRNAGINKGKAILPWVNEGDWDFMLVLGDQLADEEVFRMVPPGAVTIKIGAGGSNARFNLSSGEGALKLLSRFLPALST